MRGKGRLDEIITIEDTIEHNLSLFDVSCWWMR